MLKRSFDFSLALLGLFVFSPIMLLISIFVLLVDGCPVFYFKKSLGKNGLPFNVIKFRTMREDALAITRFGRLLRKTALDELPQLINILKGEMSFVGPRPYSIDKYNTDSSFKNKDINDTLNFNLRLKFMPGLTGLAQVYSAKHASNGKVLQHDLIYIQQHSFLSDIYIILLSISITIRGYWETPGSKL